MIESSLWMENFVQAIVENFLSLKNGGKVDFKEMSNTLFAWSKNGLEIKGDTYGR